MIFYFSATGNSKYVAERIASDTNDVAISISDCVKDKSLIFNIKKGEKLGFVSPIYFWELPEIVGNFINKCQFNTEEDPYVYYVATYYNNTGVARTNIKVDLKSRKLKLKATYGVPMVNTYTLVYYVNDVKDNEKVEAKAEKTINEIISHINNNDEGEFIKDIASPLAAKISHAVYEKKRCTNNFVVTESCDGCGLCETICPDMVIAMKAGKPEWTNEKCLLCLACVHRCPKFAIQYGNNTIDKGQYTNPNTVY